MTTPDPETEAELLDDRISLLAPKGPRGDATPARALRAWPWLAIAVVGVLAVGLLALDSRPGGIAGGASPSPSGPAAAIVATPAIGEPVGPTPQIAPAGEDSGPCGTGRIAVDPVIEPVTDPAGLDEAMPPLRPPPGGLLATAIETSDTGGSIFVAQSDRDGAMTASEIATFSGLDIQGPSGVTVVGWSVAGDTFLVRAAHESRSSGDPACANLFTVYADGSGVRYLTDNGPGDWISAAALAPRTSQIAFVQGNDLRVPDTEAPNGTARVANCPSVWSMDWSPDERRLLAICYGGLYLVVAGATETPKIVPIEPNVVPVLASWSPDSSSITLVTALGLDRRFGPLSVFDLDPSTGAATLRLETDTATEWVPSKVISPTGEWLLVEGRLLGSNDFPFFVVNLKSGVTKRLEWPIFGGAVGQESFAWLPDGESMLYGDNGTLYVLNLRERTRTEVGLVPVPDFAWVNRAP